MRIPLTGRRSAALIALVVLLAALWPALLGHAQPVHAASGTVSASPSTVVPGGTLYLSASGNGFQTGQQVTIYISPTTAGLGPFPVTATDVNGNFSIPSYPILIPANAPFQTYSVNIFVGGTVSAYVNTTFTVGSASGATIVVSPASVVPGAPFTVSGTGFTGAGFGVTLSFSGLSIGSVTVNEASGGTFTSPLIYVPVGASGGTYTVQAIDNYVPSGGVAKSASSVVSVSGTTSSSLTLNPLGSNTTVVGIPGGVISVAGINFLGQGIVQLTSPSLGISQAVADPGGSFSTAVTIPSTTPVGTYVLSAVEGGGARTAYATIVVQSSSTVTSATLVNTPSVAAAGQVVGLTGAGFTAGSAVTISGLGSTFVTVAAADGSILTTLTIPATQSAGSVNIAAQDGYGHYAAVIERIGVSGIGVTANPPSTIVAATTAVNGTGFQAGETVTVGLAAASAQPTFVSGTTATFTADGSGNFSGSYTVPNQPVGSYLLLASGASSRVQASTAFAISGTAATATPAVPPTSTPLPAATAGYVPFPTAVASPTPATGPLATVPSAATNTYFAEGYTGTAATNHAATFTEKLYLFNPGMAASSVTTTYYVYDTVKNTHATVTEHDSVAAGSTVARSVNTDAGNDRNVSIVVQATAGIQAETVISRVAVDGSVLDSASSQGTSTPGQTWYLAEGYTGASIQEYLTIFNPGAMDAHARLQYLPSNTPAPAAQAVTVPANGRVTINVRSQYNGLVKQGSRNIGISVTADHAVVVDRAMYWGDGSGSGKYGYSLGPAIAAGQTTQLFSYLPTSGGSQSFVTVLNANTGAANVTLALRDALGNVVAPFTATIPAQQRYTFVLPTLTGGNLGTVTGVLSSSQAVVAEAGIYFGGSPNVGRHPGLVLRGTQGGAVGARANVSVNGAALRLVNFAGAINHVRVTTSAGGASITLFDGQLNNRAAVTVAVPGGADLRGLLVLGSGVFSASLVNGGLGSPTAWGGNLN